MEADAGTYGALILGALCASGYVTHFLMDETLTYNLETNT